MFNIFFGFIIITLVVLMAIFLFDNSCDGKVVLTKKNYDKLFENGRVYIKEEA